MLYTIYMKATGVVVESGDLPEAEIKKRPFPAGSIIKYGVASAQPVAIEKVVTKPTDPDVMAKQIADLTVRVAALEKAKG